MKVMVLAMVRSGHNAIIQWIAENLPGSVVINNNCRKGWDRRQFEPTETRTIDNPGKGNHIISSIEDFYLPLWDKYKMSNWKFKFDQIITVIRSPKNWLASSIAAGGWANDYLDTIPEDEAKLPVNRIDAYLDYMDSYDIWEPSSSLQFQQLHSSICYDTWFDNTTFRKYLAKSIFGKLIVEKPNHCKFSSFGKDHDYTGDRSLLLNKKQKKRFDNLYKGMLQVYQERYFG